MGRRRLYADQVADGYAGDDRIWNRFAGRDQPFSRSVDALLLCPQRNDGYWGLGISDCELGAANFRYPCRPRWEAGFGFCESGRRLVQSARGIWPGWQTMEV